MKPLFIILLFISCYGMVKSTLLDCLLRCSAWDLNATQALRCKRDCHIVASFGGHLKDTYAECANVCNDLVPGQDKEDCYTACDFLFPEKRATRKTTPASGVKRKRGRPRKEDSASAING